MANDISAGELRMDATSLYREEVVTDRRIGSIRVLTPLRTDGSADPSRPVQYVGEAQLLTPAGVLPLVFELDATSLSDAIEKFSAGAAAALDRTRREIEQLRREAASQIVVPTGIPPGFDPRGGPPPAGPGPKIHLR
ncbi:MAG TPA: hypothetical protein VHZ49_01645 [Methylomirabilota bacterium]|jgi:hypothetical protein|nr:hypothetical protein [Methylomirabilota bacterium]